MVAAFDYCLHGKGVRRRLSTPLCMGSWTPRMSIICIRTRGIALRLCRRRGEADRRVFRDTVVWVPWRRPGFQLGLDIAAVKAANPPGRWVCARGAWDHRVG